MKKYSRRILILIAGILVALIGAALTHSIAVQSWQPAIDDSTAFFLQSTATPQPEDQSEIGSTDEIVVMGILIVLIVSIPIATRYKYWTRHSTP